MQMFLHPDCKRKPKKVSIKWAIDLHQTSDSISSGFPEPDGRLMNQCEILV
jgi:hypothetical protein